MKIDHQFFDLQLRHPFGIARHTRSATPILLLRITHEDFMGFGEASMVPYMGENVQTASAFLKKIDASRFIYPFDFGEIIDYLDELEPGQPAVKAAIDIALHDMTGKIRNRPCWKIFEADPGKMPLTSYTLGIDSPEQMREKVAGGRDFGVIKVKLGRANDRAIIEAIRSVTDKPLFVDANQGWTDKQAALDLIFWLREQNVQLVEQPMDKHDPDGNAWITEQSPLPIIGDEAVQRFADVEKARGVYHGINVKLMKTAGMHEAYQMIQRARSLNMPVLMGSMSETTCATLAAASLAPLCEWCDLDGPFLTVNNPFEPPVIADGRIRLNNSPGLGLDYDRKSSALFTG
ncbi:MAG: dipeptide epimerase [Mucilaginibacter polytrichastri]|nr:dipeptide epimerase [Mucilaginibacter polytrichastri]